MKTIEVSDETYEKIKDQIEADKKPKKFEPIEIHDGCFVVDAEFDHVIVKTSYDYNDIECKQPLSVVDKFIQALQEAKAFVEANG